MSATALGCSSARCRSGSCCFLQHERATGGQCSSCGTGVETWRGAPAGAAAHHVEYKSTVDPPAVTATRTVTHDPWEPVRTGCRAAGTPCSTCPSIHGVRHGVLLEGEVGCTSHGPARYQHVDRSTPELDGDTATCAKCVPVQSRQCCAAVRVRERYTRVPSPKHPHPLRPRRARAARPRPRARPRDACAPWVPRRDPRE